MKSKAKPVKGSARTKRFDVGGTVGALAGLGTLAYLMSRKKKGEDGKAEYKPQGKFPSEDGSGTSGSGGTTTKVDDAEQKRALQQSKDPKSNLVPEGADRDTLYESDKALVRTDGGKTTKANKKPAVVSQQNQNKNRQASSTNTGKVSGIKDTKKRRATSLDAYRGITAGQSQDAAAPAKEEKKKDVTTSLNDRNAVTLDKGTGKAEDKKYGIGPHGAFSSIHRALSDTRSEEQKQKSADAIFNATRGKAQNKKAGGAVKKYAAGGAIKASKMGSVKTAKPSMGSASKRADGIAQRGKTRGKVC
jgi:hypothetical protein